MKNKPISYEEFQALGHKYYTKGGDVIVECWDEQAYNEYCEMFGQMTERGALNLIGMYDEVEKEEAAAKKWMSGEPENGWQSIQDEAELMCDLMCGSAEDEEDGFLEDDDEYIPSSTYGDYSPGNPWDAPGMSIRDFI